MAKRKYNYDPQAKLFKTLMHPARLAILDVLRNREACVCHLEAALGYRQAYISQQLMELRGNGIVESRRDGLNIYYRVSKPGVFSVLDAARTALGEGTQGVWPEVLPACECPHCSQEGENIPLVAAKT